MENIGEWSTLDLMRRQANVLQKVNQCRNQLSKKSRLAIWDFEFAVIKRTILRKPCVQGLALGVCYESSCESTVYARVFDAFSLRGASDHILAEYMNAPSTSGKSLLSDKVLLDADIKVLQAQSSEIFKASSNDSKDIKRRFDALVESQPFLKLAFVVVHYSSRKAGLMLSFGMDSEIFERSLQKSYSSSEPDHVTLFQSTNF